LWGVFLVVKMMPCWNSVPFHHFGKHHSPAGSSHEITIILNDAFCLFFLPENIPACGHKNGLLVHINQSNKQ